jgi:predicted lipoprotein with Yx(FWY)xxD motif
MRNAKLIIPALAVVAIAIVIAVVTGFSHGQSTSRSLVGKANVGGRTILVNRRGLTLYHLSVERKGHFICTTQACLSLWKPIVVGRSGKLTGAKFLGRVKRPGGRFQLTYRGGPLYTFVQDRKRGDMKGDGFKDVGVWHPVFLAGKAATSPPPPPPPGYGSSY